MSTKFEFIDKNWYCGTILKNNEDISAKVKNDIAVVNDIDTQILNLIRQRNYMLYGLNCKCLKYNSTTLILGANPRSVWKDYKKNGFNSQLVKDVVANIRTFFLDDENEKYHNLFCTHIIHEEYGYGSDDIEFIFEDTDGHSMRLSFDIKKYENEYLYKNKIINGYIYFGIKIGRDYYTIERSFNIKDIKAAIEKWIDNGFEAEKYEFEHNTLLDSAAEIFDDFEKMRAYNCYYAVKEDEDREAIEDKVVNNIIEDNATF